MLHQCPIRFFCIMLCSTLHVQEREDIINENHLEYLK